MRLINTATLQLEVFYGSIPEYAILSHTWGANEVTLQDYSHHFPASEERFAKILATCCQARADGIQYCWVDTCCIDKTSSAELTEAINSMFTWYKLAKICYAYLVDFDLDVNRSGSVSSRIAGCRWFTRGWCLQELVAPSELRFYDCNWRLIGDKSSLRTSIFNLTNIGEDILADSNRMYSCSVAQRMSWASKRKTSRIEDIAYSLLGIFDINMPMLYGEGDKAFLRLQEEIAKRSNDLSIFAWKTGGGKGAYVDMLARSPASFEGCHTIVDPSSSDLPLSNGTFAITNRGILFSSPTLYTLKLQTTQESADHVLALNCYRQDTEGTQWKYMLLQKIAPGLFIRAQSPEKGCITKLPTSHLWTMEKDFHVLAKVTPNIQTSLESYHRHSFEVRTNITDLSRFSIQSLEPREAWDAPRSRFLTQGNPSFMAYLKIYPKMENGQQLDFFVVVLGFQGRGSAMVPFGHFVHPDIWIRNEAPGRTTAWLVSSVVNGLSDPEDHPQSEGVELELPMYKANLSIQTRMSRGVPVHKVMINWTLYRVPKRKL